MKILSLSLLLFAILTSMLFVIDRITSENPSDSATIRFSLSDIDSSGCDLCSIAGEYFYSGCKFCTQDSVMFAVSSSENSYYEVGWGNDSGIYGGDIDCDGHIQFPKTMPNPNDLYWVEIIKNGSTLQSSLYSNEDYSEKVDSIFTTLCSSPTNLKFLRVSNDDGKPAGNGGKLMGAFDDVQIWDNVDYTTNVIFSSSFDECSTITCDDTWVMQNIDRIFVDLENDSLKFSAEVSGTLDYAHYELPFILPEDSWILRFKFNLTDILPHPHGKGILQLEPELRQLFLGIPSIISAFVSFFVIRKTQSSFYGIMLLIVGVILTIGLSSFFLINFSSFSNFSEHTIRNILGISIGVIILILGIKKTLD